MPENLIVHLIEPQEVARRSLASQIMSFGYAVRAHISVSAFFEHLPVSGRACLIAVIGRRSHMNIAHLLERLRSLNVDIPTIFITGDGDVGAAVAAMKAGAADFLKKPVQAEVLLTAIDRIANQRGSRWRGATEIRPVADRIRQLTDREHQVFTAVLDGLQNKTIAFNLGISSRTVEVHRANVMAKMEARSLGELMRMVFAAGTTVFTIAGNSSTSAM